MQHGRDDAFLNADGKSSANHGTKFCPSCGLEVEMAVTVCPNDSTSLILPIANDPIFVGRYEFLGTIGAGGMAVIYKARQTILNKLVAIKTLHAHLVTPKAIRRFQIEGKVASTLQHPNIIAIHDFGMTNNGVPYMVMDYVEGETLAELIGKGTEISTTRFIDLFKQVVSGLSHAHRKGVLHRDIKPSNIMLGKSDTGADQVRIMDFGIAKLLSDSESGFPHLTKTGDAIGSPSYMSPEQAKGGVLDQRSDLYSLGCVMYEVLSGTPPFSGRSSLETMMMHMNQQPPTITEASLGRQVDPALEQLVMKLLQKDPAERYQSMDDVASALWKIEKLRSGMDPLSEQEEVLESGMSSSSGSRNCWRGNVYKAVPAMALTVICSLVAVYIVWQNRALPKQDGTSSESSAGESKEPVVRSPASKSEVQQPRSETEVSAREAVEDCVQNRAVIDLSSLSWECKIKDADLQPFEMNTNATSVSLKDLKDVTDVGLEHLSHLCLRELIINGTKAADLHALKNMSSLIKLNANSINLNDKGVNVILGLTYLKNLELESTSIEDSQVDKFKRFKNLKELDLKNCSRVTDAEIQKLKRVMKGCCITFSPPGFLADTKVNDKLAEASHYMIGGKGELDLEAAQRLVSEASKFEGISDNTRKSILAKQAEIDRELKNYGSQK